MSFLDDIDFIGDEASGGPDVIFTSGAWVGSGANFIQKFMQAIRDMAFKGIDNTLDLVIPKVAKKTGLMRSQLAFMFESQNYSLQGNQGFRIIFNRKVLDGYPHYLKYHDIEWELNPKFASGYKQPTTPGTAPFSENEIFELLHLEMLKALSANFIQNGFSFSIKIRS